jgi:hypothetical protein
MRQWSALRLEARAQASAGMVVVVSLLAILTAFIMAGLLLGGMGCRRCTSTR